MDNYKVYYHKVPKNISGYDFDKYYIGISCRKNLQDRWGRKGSGYKSQPFYRAIKKYGWNNIEHKILFENISAEQAKNIESYLISELRSKLEDRGYNTTSGGDGVKNCDYIKVHHIYCAELNMVFKNSNIAGCYTGENPNTIYNRCRIYNGVKSENMKYSYCFIEDMYKYYKASKMSYCSKPVVDVSTGIVYGSFEIANKILGLNTVKGSLLDVNKYNKRKHNGMLYKKKYLMRVEEYLKIFDMTAKNCSK